jgi:hypothetical protein
LRKKSYIFLLVVAWVTIFPSDALAYLDPGTGSLIVQSVIAALAAIGYGLRLYWGRIRSLFKRPKDRIDLPSGRPPDGPA